MTEQEIKSLKKGDVICYPHPDFCHMVYGIIDDTELHCSQILGDRKNESGIDYYTGPCSIDNYDSVRLADEENARLVKILFKFGMKLILMKDELIKAENVLDYIQETVQRYKEN